MDAFSEKVKEDIRKNISSKCINNIIINTYKDTIIKLLALGYSKPMIIIHIENDLNIEHGKIKNQAFNKALSKIIAKNINKEDKNSVEKTEPEKPKVHPLDLINTNITGQEKKRKNIFDE